jgi:hypothetical protein
MNFSKYLLLTSCSILIPSFSIHASAEDYYINLNTNPAKGNGIFDGVNHGDRAIINATLNHSYCCSVFSPSNSAGDAQSHPGISSITSAVGNTQIPFEKNSAITPAISFGDRSARACFTTNNESTFVVKTAPFYVDLNIPDGTADDLTIQCEDTTLHGSFNTFASDFVFLEIINHSETDTSTQSPRVVTVTALDTDGSTLFTLPVGIDKRADIDIHSRVGSNKIGALRINHTAPKGAISAYVAEYKSDPTAKSGLTLVGRQQASQR